MTNLPASILTLCDRGQSPAEIAAALGVSAGYVYKVLRDERPDRPRKSRRQTSEKPAQIRALAAREIAVPRIAFLLDCSTAYVYRILKG